MITENIGLLGCYIYAIIKKQSMKHQEFTFKTKSELEVLTAGEKTQRLKELALQEESLREEARSLIYKTERDRNLRLANKCRKEMITIDNLLF